MSETDTTDNSALENLAVNTIRVLSFECVQRANSGHPGLPMGCADLAYTLFTNSLKFDPKDPGWPDRDRFVLSAGHGSMLMYSMLHLCGYDVPLEELKNFRQWGSMTPGHPEYGDTPGVETTTGPLGQGTANAVGLALAESLLAARFNTAEHTLVDHFTYALVSDGDLMEGISHEAASLAGHLGLGKLVYLFDSNAITIEGDTDLASSENTAGRFENYGWHVQEIDGHDRQAIAGALEAARGETARPSIIIATTTIGFGSPNKAGTSGVHGSPLGDEECGLTREALGWDYPECTVPDEVRPLFLEPGHRGAEKHSAWNEMLEDYRDKNPELAAEWARMQAGEMPAGLREKLPVFESSEGSLATRSASGKVINAIAEAIPELIGGSADLAPSNNTMVSGQDSIQGSKMDGRNMHFGIREHAMGAMMNGMALHGGIRPYGGTFLVFSDYMRPSVRLAALMKQPVVYIWTHDSIFLGEDGPTHQPVEHLAALRAIPNLRVFRPADANETAMAWALSLEHRKGPSAILLSRQGLPIYDETVVGKGSEKGGYVIEREEGDSGPAVILLASGSEVATAREAAALLKAQGTGVRVISMPCWEVFEEQDADYRESVLPRSVTARVAVEAACSFGWDRYVGADGAVVCLDRFGASAPIKDLAENFGFTAENVAAKASALLEG
ncbi:MAG: transketolase [Planctomycetota bacterium]|nr:transketolase [Planctomycetota bacterium]